MVVAYTNETSLNVGDVEQPIAVLNMRNVTVNVGCACVLRQADRIGGFVHNILNKRSRPLWSDD
jgi:hypothetical protein